MKFLNSPRSASALYPRPLGLAQFLDRMPALGAALRHAREGGRQYDVLMEAVPERLKRFVVAITASGSTLSLTVDSPEAAHLARLLNAEMLTNLSRKGLKFSEISLRAQSTAVIRRTVRVRPSPIAGRKLNSAADQMSSERLQTSMRKLARTLDRS